MGMEEDVRNKNRKNRVEAELNRIGIGEWDGDLDGWS